MADLGDVINERRQAVFNRWSYAIRKGLRRVGR